MRSGNYRSILSLLFLAAGFSLNAQYAPDWKSLDKREIPGWFGKAKFGIFIHWGVYSVPSFSPVVPDGYSEWYWCNYNDSSRKNHDPVVKFHNRTYGAGFTYDEFIPMFRAELFDPVQWASVFKKSGARYVVLTSKHHDGFCLWPSAEADKSWGRAWNSMSAGPRRDLLGELAGSVRRAGLEMGVYYSLMEWYNPVFKADTAKYVNDVMIPQFRELVNRYKPSVIFADGEWIMDDTAWKSEEILAWLFNDSPVKDHVVVNDRWGKTSRALHPSTYFTSEYGTGMNRNVVWEESRGMGQSYGYNRVERVEDYKTADELIIILSDIVSRGGNLLLDIGPAPDGSIPVIMEERLLGMGKWLDVNGEAIYGTTPWKHENQWSEGERPAFGEGHYQTGFDVTDLVRSSGGKARIEMFFTRKGSDLYCIVPSYSQGIKIRGVCPSRATGVEILGCKVLPGWKFRKGIMMIDLSGFRPGDIGCSSFVIKISGISE
jgi:alpha-L-fucosidase